MLFFLRFAAQGLRPFPIEKLIRFLAVFTAFTAFAFAEPFAPSGIFLTWQHDPTTTMTIDWHSIDGEDGEIELVKSEAQH